MIKKLAIFVVLIIVVYGAFNGVGIVNENGIDEFSAEDIAKIIVSESTDKTPKLVNEEIRLDQVKGNGLEVIFFNTLISGASSEFIDEDVRSVYFPAMKQVLCADANTQVAFSKGVVFKYVYSGNDNVKITEFIVDKSSCKSNA